MLITVKTFNGHNINDGTNYRAYLLNPHGGASARPVFIDQAKADSQDSGTYTVNVQSKVLSIEIVNYANRNALIAQLKTWLKRGTEGDLIVTFSDDDTDYQMTCRVINLVQDPGYPVNFQAVLQTGFSSWRAVEPDTYNWELTGTGGSHTINLPLSDDETPLSATFVLSGGPANGFQYQRFYQLLNVPSPVPALGYGPWCITIDTASLIADNSNKCQLNGGIDADDDVLPYDTVTGSIPTIGSGYLGTEQISWTSRTGTTSGNLTGVTRGIGGTTAASHADNTEIKVSRMLANCADLRIFIDGKEVNRWISNPNNASTKVWFNLTMKRGFSLTIREAYDNSSNIPWLRFKITPDTLNAVSALPNEGILVHGTEWIKYVKNPAGPYRVDVVERGILGSTKQAHAIGDVFKYMEHVILVCYGNSALVSPSTLDEHYDDTKPLFSLSSSSNTSWVYDATSLFYDIAGTGRTGGWTPSILRRLGEESYFYNIKENATSGDPAMGMRMGSFLGSTGWLAEMASIVWTLQRSCGADTTTFTGQKFRTDAGWPTLIVALRTSVDGIKFTSAWSEATPASPDVPTALGSHSSVSMGGAKWLRFTFYGAFAAAENSFALFEILTGTVNWLSANLPSGTLLSQQVSGQLELTLENGANENSFDVLRPMLIGLPLVMDAEARTILYNNVNAHEAVTLDDEGREHWIGLQPGENVLTITSVDVGTLAVALSWFRRRF